MAGEHFLQGFYRALVFVEGYDEDWRAGRSYKLVKNTVERLIEWLYQSDMRLFPEDAKLAGSQKQDLHVQNDASASDFDFLIPLRFNPTLRLRGCMNVWDPSYYETRLATHIYLSKGVPVFRCGSRLVLDLDTLRADRATAYCDELRAEKKDKFKESIDNHHLDPVLILQDFHRYVHKALTADENSHPRDNDPMFKARMIKPTVSQIHKSIKERMTLQPWDPKYPAVQLIFQLGTDEKVSVDLVPALQDKVVLSEDWQRGDLARLSDWWDKEPGNSQERFRQKGEQVGRVGADVVAKDGFWRFSFANAETAFLRDLDSDGGQRRKALRLLKFINKEFWVPEYGKILTSYHLKTLLLWARDIYQEKEKWETLASSLKTLLSLLRHCVNKGNLPHYFLRDFNLFNKRYREGNGFYEHLALQVLTREVELMNVDLVQYISWRVLKKVSESPGPFSRAVASLREFKESHQEALKKLKQLEEKELYEWEEKQPDRSVRNPTRWNLDSILAEMKQNEGQPPRCEGKAEEPVRGEFQPRSGPGAAKSHPTPGGKKEDLTLDPATAHPQLEISKDGKEVRCGTSTGNISCGPRRFDTANCVVARQSFSAGQHYWEVSVGRKKRWNLGVVSDQAERRGRLIQRKFWWLPWSEEVCTEGYWLIGYNKQKAGKPYWAFDTNPMPIDCCSNPQKIGVYLDYAGREVTFYNADDPGNLTPLYSFYNADFKNAPVYPVFDPCWHDNGGNTLPLKIL